MEFNYVDYVILSKTTQTDPAGDLSTIVDTDESRSVNDTKFADYFGELEICRDFVHGRCKRTTKKCRFSHDIEAHKDDQIANGPCGRHFRYRSCRFGNACKFTHDAEWLHQQRVENGRCRAFVTGYCKAGKACEFYHDRKLKKVFNQKPRQFALHRLIVEKQKGN